MDPSDATLSNVRDGLLLQPATETVSADLAAAARDVAEASDFRELFEQQKRLFDLAMSASQMGTWRYTIADNVCVYDDNARRLYGLTEARFLHDEEGVKSKFHPDDLEVMWSRVARAFDPSGDGRYDVEYRVRQADGTWRWLSAWGLVDFEGEGADRKPVAIVGASRDLTERKQGEQLQRLLLNELGHRIKNSLARVQAVVDQTLKSAEDLPSAREALNRRICSMAQAHDLLTSKDWSDAPLAEVVVQAFDCYDPVRVELDGPAIDLSEKQTLAFSMALHELVTNATKYGALSCPEGRVSVRWTVSDGQLDFRWTESGGPTVTAPTQHGFGTRLLERIVVSDLGGEIELDYDSSGLRCTISAAL